MQEVLEVNHLYGFMFQYMIISTFQTKLKYKKMKRFKFRSITNKQCINSKYYQQKKIKKYNNLNQKMNI